MAEANDKPATSGDSALTAKRNAQVTQIPRSNARDEALIERIFRRAFESMGAIVDKGLGRENEFAPTTLSTSALIRRMKRAIDDHLRHDAHYGRIAPHLMRLKIEWGTHSDAPREAIEELEHELLAAAIDHINDNRLRTLAPVRVETVVDIFTTGIAVEPSFGEYEEELNKRVAAQQQTKQDAAAYKAPTANAAPEETNVQVRYTIANDSRELKLRFQAGGRRFNIGRARDNDLFLDHASVSKVHAAIRMNEDGTLILADTGSTNGTFINGRKLHYGEARTIEAGDVISFGDAEVRFRKMT